MIPTPQELAARLREDEYRRINDILRIYFVACTSSERIADAYREAGYVVERGGNDWKISLPEELL